MKRSTSLLGYIALPTTATTYTIHRGLCHLEEKYPEIPASGTTSTLLLTPSFSSQCAAYTDVFAARIPLNTLQALTHSPNKTALENAWTRRPRQSGHPNRRITHRPLDQRHIHTRRHRHDGSLLMKPGLRVCFSTAYLLYSANRVQMETVMDFWFCGRFPMKRGYLLRRSQDGGIRGG
jgi:hypothetical protein